jgi:glutathione S-transferase
MYTLYYAPGAASFAVHWMLIELDVPFELVKVDLEAGAQKAPDYLALNPSGQVPTLVVDGAPYAESVALLMLLAERHPDARFAPLPGSAARASYLQAMVTLANVLLPAFRGWFYTKELVSPEHAEDAKEHARVRIERAFERMDGALADGRAYLLGEEISAADLLLTMLARWSRNMPRPATRWTHLGAYVNRMRTRRGLREVHAREGLTDWIEG